MTTAARNGRIVTFYSYKGGTGRSMALANVAWLLASGGQRVLTIDWDLEAPGLHRYFEPFLADKSLERSTGIIDFVRDFTTAAVSTLETKVDRKDKEWYQPHANVLRHAVHVDWDFPDGGTLDLVPAGRQDAAYALRVNSFDWQDFYQRLGGGVLLETVKKTLRELYDFILIDSRTGVSDTSGICTIQMPDALVICFTLNRQSIYGASAAARSAYKQRHTSKGEPTLTIWPVPMRVEFSEKDRLEVAQTMARARFSGLMGQLAPEGEESYWTEIGVPYEPYYAYEEVLATFRERSRQSGSILASFEKLAGYLNGTPLQRAAFVDDERRTAAFTAFTTRSAGDFRDELALLGGEYEHIRRAVPPSNARTALMTQVIERAQVLGGQRDAGLIAEELFRTGTAGNRVVGLALARKEPHRRHVEMALSAIADSQSAFEQFNALQLARALLPQLHPSAALQLRGAIEGQVGNTITPSDTSRWTPAQALLKALADTSAAHDAKAPGVLSCAIGGMTVPIVGYAPSTTYIRYNDGLETHGPWVVTRGVHALKVPAAIRVGRFPVTNELFLAFVDAGGYDTDAFWDIPATSRRAFATADGTSLGPAHWPNAHTLPEGKRDHPVQAISYLEARAFVRWCNAIAPADAPWTWSLPPEDHWELAARSESGLIYPWGDAFDAAKCNSSESGIGDTCEVTRFASGTSAIGCYHLAGNVWEFVDAADVGSGSLACVLRGGSFKNNRFELRSYLRLIGVPIVHRPPDFGFRLAQVEATRAT